MKVAITEIFENPKNPRFIRDEKFKKLVKSIKDFPEMLSVRKIVVDENMIVLGGNMRLRALKEAGVKEVEIEKVNWTEKQKEEFLIKDNLAFGEWDFEILANEWEVEDLENWGLDVPVFEEEKEIKEIDLPQNQFQIIIELENEDEQEKLFIELQNRGFDIKSRIF